MAKKISSLSQLIHQLRVASKSEYKSIGVELDIPLEEFIPFAHWSDEHYTRNCIIREQKFELILLCWEPGQKTPVHCHGGEECWVYIIDGMLHESIYQFDSDNLTQDAKVELKVGRKSFMTDEKGYHSLENKTNSRAMSLHLYMKPIDECTIYDKQIEEFVPISMSYYSHEGVLENIEI